jgi:hypothetical protein
MTKKAQPVEKNDPVKKIKKQITSDATEASIQEDPATETQVTSDATEASIQEEPATETQVTSDATEASIQEEPATETLAPDDTLAPAEGPVDPFTPPLADRARSVFASHSVDELYFTADGTCFIEKYHAVNHGVSIGDDRTLTIKREEV